MAIETGIDTVGDMAAWGAHGCLFYETNEDLLDALTSYCKLGSESGEDCQWLVAGLLTIEGATDALKDAVPDLDRCLADSSIEIVSARALLLQGGTLDSQRVTDDLYEKLAHASARGYVTGLDLHQRLSTPRKPIPTILITACPDDGVR